MRSACGGVRLFFAQRCCCCRCDFTGQQLPEGWTIKSGKVAPWGQQPGGATRLQVFKDDGSVAKVEDLLKEGILKGKENPIGLHG